MTQVVSLSFFRFGSFRSRLWAFSMMGLARGAIKRTPDIGFWKLCGSGSGEGFTPIPNTAVYAILATFPDAATAQAAQDTAIFQNYRAHAVEDWTVFMAVDTTRGSWSGQTPFLATAQNTNGPLAALTRATIKPSILTKFWRRVPNISAVIGRDPNVVFKIGIGEVPWLHQVTFSIWPDATAMHNFAHTGPHAEAIKAVRADGWFHEELYARFALLSDTGTWGGASPLQQLDTA
ncbi:MAG: spheroidene monooxygenase [Tateyamaria sp.]|jgi:spheroidene monooxygenase|uniref:spheroidene monooxygenase n=1 Tax=unclassified Tateyamaria TaxID=2645127 RepID=UPI000D55408B|nr:spheroidene monooxygenase [Tateyamaria sp. Alg231-49]